MVKLLDVDGVLTRIRAQVVVCGTAAAAARALGISPQYLSDILSRRRDPSDRVCRGLGLRREVVYRVSSAAESPVPDKVPA